MSSFEAYFASHDFLFVARSEQGTPDFIRTECARLDLARYATVILDEPTRGQAETVALGLDRAAVPDAAPLTIFNIDTFRPGFRFPIRFDPDVVDGYLEVFRGSGENWSFVRPPDPGSDRVAETAEKVAISDLCCTGLYHFRAAGLYRRAYGPCRDGAAQALGVRELYVAPLYNLLIRDGCDIRYELIPREAVIFCGVPAEYEAFLKG